MVRIKRGNVARQRRRKVNSDGAQSRCTSMEELQPQREAWGRIPWRLW